MDFLCDSIIDTVDNISETVFVEMYLGKRAVLIKGMLNDWPARHLWTPDYLASKNPSLVIPIKIYKKNYKKNRLDSQQYGFDVEQLTFQNFDDYLKNKESKSNEGNLLYFHNFPLLHSIPELSNEVDAKIIQTFLPKWYRKYWMKFCLFFIGPKNSLTPLHFDCLLTNNIFFQVMGKKCFSIISAHSSNKLPRYKWRYFSLNLENQMDRAYLKDMNIPVADVVVEAGDVLYMPPGMLHQVRGLETSISFNIDFHTKKSVIRGLISIIKGMPIQNIYYNLIFALGVIGGIPQGILFPLCKRYLTKGCR